MPALLITFLATTSVSLLAMRLAENIQGRINFVPGFFGLQLSHNPGVAFGLRIPDPWQTRIIVVALILVAIAAYFHQESKNRAVAFGLILGGAVANLVDRYLDGTVTDFISVGTFPTFNIADSAICIGVAFLIIESFFDR